MGRAPYEQVIHNVILNKLSICIYFILTNLFLQEMLGEAEVAAAKKLSENEARVTELTDRWKDRWRETQKILEVHVND